LYSILTEEGNLDRKRHVTVGLGAEYLGVQLGFVSAIDTEAERFEVLVSSGGALLAERTTYDLPDTHCRRCVESGSSLAVSGALGRVGGRP
jgi:hypothetical protein